MNESREIPNDKRQITKKSQAPTRKLQSAFWNFGLGPWNFFGPCYLSFEIFARGDPLCPGVISHGAST
jgi:hypothetical protein